MKWIPIVLLAICYATYSVYASVKRDGGFGCSQNWRFFNSSGLDNDLKNDQLSYKEKMTYSSDMVVELGIANIRHSPKLGSVFADVEVMNTGSETKNISLRMVISSEGVVAHPFNVRYGNYEVNEANSVNVELAAGSREVATFYFDYGLLNKKLEQQVLKQTVFIDEASSDEIIILRDLTRVKWTYNCIVGSGHSFKLG